MVLFWNVGVRKPLTVLELQRMYAMGTLISDDDDDELTLDEDDLPDSDSLTGSVEALLLWKMTLGSSD